MYYLLGHHNLLPGGICSTLVWCICWFKVLFSIHNARMTVNILKHCLHVWKVIEFTLPLHNDMYILTDMESLYISRKAEGEAVLNNFYEYMNRIIGLTRNASKSVHPSAMCLSRSHGLRFRKNKSWQGLGKPIICVRWEQTTESFRYTVNFQAQNNSMSLAQ